MKDKNLTQEEIQKKEDDYNSHFFKQPNGEDGFINIKLRVPVGVSRFDVLSEIMKSIGTNSPILIPDELKGVTVQSLYHQGSDPDKHLREVKEKLKEDMIRTIDSLDTNL